MMNRILAMQWNMPSDVQISNECRDLLSKLLVANPQKRLTMQQVMREGGRVHRQVLSYGKHICQEVPWLLRLNVKTSS